MSKKSKLRQEYEAVLGVVEVRYFDLYDAKGNLIYAEVSDDGYWSKYGYDAEGNEIYRKSSDGESCECQYNARGKMIYYESSVNGVMLDKRPCSDKVFIDEKTGKKFKMTEIK
jgi:YD repeat-containing protein